jgi:hypothetical protein
VVAAFSAARRADGAAGLFRGTGALLLREVPFYTFGLMAYTQLKSVFNGAPAALNPVAMLRTIARLPAWGIAHLSLACHQQLSSSAMQTTIASPFGEFQRKWNCRPMPSV